jgi:tRNA A-37 threonylcarbamoyl transferase component Bud32
MPDLESPPAPSGEQPVAAAEVLAAWVEEMSNRWQAGERILVEPFLAEHSASAVEPSILRQIVLLEMLLRRERGEAIEPKEYLQRFGALQADLDRQFRLLQAIDLAAPASICPPAQAASLPVTGPLEQPPTIKYQAPAGEPGPGAPGPAALALPGYRVVGLIGRGGSGAVYQAIQLSLGRIVAIKMLCPELQQDASLLQRLKGEARALGQLQLPGVVQIHEVNTINGQHYLILEYVEGGSLAAALSGRVLDSKQAARMVHDLAATMQAVHGKGIVHRDIKPGNILLTADGQPKVTDFGLARRLGEQERASLRSSLNGRTVSSSALSEAQGDVLGTPSYMAPEQARGETNQIGPATDVYQLGAVLYEMLTGRPPFRGTSLLDTLDQVIHDAPLSPRYLHPGLSRDLATICLKCLEKEMTKRYATAKELAEDLQRFLEGKPIHARPIGLLGQAIKWARRQPLAASLIGLVVTSVLTGLVGMTLAWSETNAARLRAEQESEARLLAYDEESKQRRRAEGQLYFARISLANRERLAGKPAWARQQLDACPGGQRNWEWYCLDRLIQGKGTRSWEGHERALSCLAFDKSSATLASVGGNGTICLWQVSSGKLLHKLRGHLGSVAWVCFSPDGKDLASAGDDQSILLWHADSGRPWKQLLGHDQAVSVVAFHPNGRLLASATFDSEKPGEVWLWDIESGKAIHRYRGHTSRITGLAYSPDGKWLASSSHDATVRLLDGLTAREVRIFRGHQLAVSSVAFSPDGRLIASAAGRVEAESPTQEEVLIHETDTGKVLHKLQGHRQRPTTVAFGPDGKRLATAGWDGEVKLWDVATGQEVLALEGHQAAIMHVTFSPDGRWLASGGLDHRVRLWDGGAEPGK